MRYNRLKIGTHDVGSNQWWRRLNLGSTIEPTSSLPIFKRLYHIIYKTLALFICCAAEKELRTIIMQIFSLIQAFVSSKIIKVSIGRFCVRYDWWRRLQRTSSVHPVWIGLYLKHLSITFRNMQQHIISCMRRFHCFNWSSWTNIYWNL